ncbi:MAG TPA: aldo/keto reductase [Anaerolineales bacterium]|nr:aldo/keto reductase [Anaerolineales bacterium]
MYPATIQFHSQSGNFSRIAWGVWRLPEWRLSAQQLLALVESAIQIGLTTIDHADIYGGYTCESLFGEILYLKPSLRQHMQLVSKCGIKLVSPARPAHKVKSYDTSAAHILASAENSLRQLRTDYLDLLLIHRPDPFMDADETADALFGLVQSGKVRSVGVSNFTPSQFNLLQSRLPIPLVTNQVEASLLHREPFLDGTLEQCQQLRIAPMVWSPLAGGKLFNTQHPAYARLFPLLERIAAEVGAGTAEQVALAWLLAHPARIVPVVGSGNLTHLAQAVQALQINISREQWFELWTAAAGSEVP